MKAIVPIRAYTSGKCVLLQVDNDIDELAESAINILLAFESRTRERESPSIGLEQLK
jgi:hypothetical protein